MEIQTILSLGKWITFIGVLLTAIGGFMWNHASQKLDGQQSQYVSQSHDLIIQKLDHLSETYKTNELTQLNVEDLEVVPDEILPGHGVLKFTIQNHGDVPIKIKSVIFTMYHTKDKELVWNNGKAGQVNYLYKNNKANYRFDISDIFEDKKLKEIIGDNPFTKLLIYLTVIYNTPETEDKEYFSSIYYFRYLGGYGKDVVEPMTTLEKGIYDISSNDIKQSHLNIIEYFENSNKK